MPPFTFFLMAIAHFTVTATAFMSFFFYHSSQTLHVLILKHRQVEWIDSLHQCMSEILPPLEPFSTTKTYCDRGFLD